MRDMLTAVLASIRRAFPVGTRPPSGPPPGWERRTLHFPDGTVVHFEAPIAPGALPPAHPRDPRRALREALDRRDRLLSAGATPPVDRVGAVPPPRAASVRPAEHGHPHGDGCPLLIQFLERRARR